MVSYPLINYSLNKIDSLINLDLAKVFNYNCKLDNFKIKWSPRFISSTELYIYDFLYSISKKSGYCENQNETFNKFVKFNNLSQQLKNQFNLKKKI